MNREDFFQQAMLRMADTILMRASETPTPAQLASKSREYAQALHDEMLAGLTKLDGDEELAKRKPRPPVGGTGGVPTLQPTRLQPSKKSSTYDDPDEESPSCPDCSGDMKKRDGRFGPFWGCRSYPNCKGIVNIRE